MTATAAERVMQRLNPAPYFEHLGAQLLEAGEGTATVRIPTRPEFGRSQNTGDGTAHGGVVASAIDMAASCALITLLAEDEGRTTIDLTVHYLAPAKGDLTAVATVRRRGGRTAIIDVELTAMDTLAAIGRATFAILRERGMQQR
jgi:uncharacterized protein (TIGR00369 family)